MCLIIVFVIPGTWCVVAVCKNSLNNTNNVSFQRFQVEKPNIFKIWVAQCRRKDAFNPNILHICSIHFKEQYLRHQLMGTKQKIHGLIYCYFCLLFFAGFTKRWAKEEEIEKVELDLLIRKFSYSKKRLHTFYQ